MITPCPIFDGAFTRVLYGVSIKRYRELLVVAEGVEHSPHSSLLVGWMPNTALSANQIRASLGRDRITIGKFTFLVKSDGHILIRCLAKQGYKAAGLFSVFALLNTSSCIIITRYIYNP